MNENDRTTLEQAIYEEMELTPEMIRSIRTLCGVCLCSFVKSKAFKIAIGSEQSGNRPAVVLQNDVGNFYSPTLIVATLTSKAAKKYTQPTHCLLVNEFLSVPSIVQAEQIFTVDKSRVLKFLGHLTPEEMDRVDDAVRASLALNPMGSIQRLPPIIRSTAAYAPPEVVDGKPPLYNIPTRPSNHPLRMLGVSRT